MAEAAGLRKRPAVRALLPKDGEHGIWGSPCCKEGKLLKVLTGGVESKDFRNRLNNFVSLQKRGGRRAGVDLGYILHFTSDSKGRKQWTIHSIAGPKSNHGVSFLKLVCLKNRGRFLVSLVVPSSTREIHLVCKKDTVTAREWFPNVPPFVGPMILPSKSPPFSGR